MSIEKFFTVVKDGTWHSIHELGDRLGIQTSKLIELSKLLSEKGLIKYEENAHRIRIEPAWQLLLPEGRWPAWTENHAGNIPTYRALVRPASQKHNKGNSHRNLKYLRHKLLSISKSIQQSLALLSSFKHPLSLPIVHFFHKILPQQIRKIPIESLKIQIRLVHNPHFVRRSQSRLQNIDYNSWPTAFLQAILTLQSSGYAWNSKYSTVNTNKRLTEN